jgi:hypothetical protein
MKQKTLYNFCKSCTSTLKDSKTIGFVFFDFSTIFYRFSKLLRITLNTFAEGPLTDFSEITKGSLLYRKHLDKNQVNTQQPLPAQGRTPVAGGGPERLRRAVVAA